MAEEADLQRELADARATIAAQAVQIHRLEQRSQESPHSGILRELMQVSEVIGETVGDAPYRRLLASITQAARRLFDARASSIMLLDEDANELVFEASTDEDVMVGRRFPAHQGIAGWTIMTGEPMAVGDVRRDPRWQADFAESTGYVPKSILSVPMHADEEIVGVLQILDKASAATFGLDDMELAGLFAHQAALAVEQARLVNSIGKMLVDELGRLAGEHGDDELVHAATAATGNGTVLPQETLELAQLVNAISRRGEHTRALALEILSAVMRHAR